MIITMIVSNFCKVSKRNMYFKKILLSFEECKTVRRITCLGSLNKKPRLIVKIYDVRINKLVS